MTHLLLLGVNPFVVMMPMALKCFPGILAALQRSPAHGYRSLPDLLLINPLENGHLQEKITGRMTTLALLFHKLMYVSNESMKTLMAKGHQLLMRLII